MTNDDVTSMTAPIFASIPRRTMQVILRFARVFREQGHDLYLVGGPVRDLLLERAEAIDFDFTTDALPADTQELGRSAGAASIFTIGERFGTIGFAFPEDAETGEPGFVFEITTYRSEAYPDETRKPVVQHDVTLIDDLSRRDFTINAIAADPVSGELVDPFYGQADLAMGVIRAVGDADERFNEDPLRLLRAARFVAQLGFRVERETQAAMERQAESLKRISVERVYMELTKLLCGDYAGAGLEVMLDTGLLTVAMPELQPLERDALIVDRRGRAREKDLWSHTKLVIEQAPARPVVRWAALLHDAAKPLTRSIDAAGEVHFFGHEREGAILSARLLKRLKADRATQQSVFHIVDDHLRPAMYGPDWTDSAVRRLMLDAGDDLDDLLDLVAADVTSARQVKQRAAAERIERLRAHIDRLNAEYALEQFQSPLDGTALMAMFSRPPGRWIAEIKEHLRELVIDGELAPGDTGRAAEIARELVGGEADGRPQTAGSGELDAVSDEGCVIGWNEPGAEAPG